MERDNHDSNKNDTTSVERRQHANRITATAITMKKFLITAYVLRTQTVSGRASFLFALRTKTPLASNMQFDKPVLVDASRPIFAS